MDHTKQNMVIFMISLYFEFKCPLSYSIFTAQLKSNAKTRTKNRKHPSLSRLCSSFNFRYLVCCSSKKKIKTHPNITACHSMILLSVGAPETPAGGSSCSFLKSLNKRRRAFVVIIESLESYSTAKKVVCKISRNKG